MGGYIVTGVFPVTGGGGVKGHLLRMQGGRGYLPWMGRGTYLGWGRNTYLGWGGGPYLGWGRVTTLDEGGDTYLGWGEGRSYLP